MSEKRDRDAAAGAGLEDGVRRWLDTSGRALELRVARQFRRLGNAAVEQSRAYNDVQTAKQREPDVVARFEWTGLNSVPCSLAVAVECKSSKGNPWVAFLSDSPAPQLNDLDAWVVFGHGRLLGSPSRSPVCGSANHRLRRTL
jgi:hypothetical protein